MSKRNRKRELSIPPPIRIKNTRTGRVTTAAGGKDAALILRTELDRRTGIELAEQS